MKGHITLWCACMVLLLTFAPETFARPRGEQSSASDGTNLQASGRSVTVDRLNSCIDPEQRRKLVYSFVETDKLPSSRRVDDKEESVLEVMERCVSGAIEQLGVFRILGREFGGVSKSGDNKDGVPASAKLFRVFLVFDDSRDSGRVVRSPHDDTRKPEDETTHCNTFVAIGDSGRHVFRSCSVLSRPFFPVDRVFREEGRDREQRAICRRMSADLLEICSRNIERELQRGDLFFYPLSEDKNLRVEVTFEVVDESVDVGSVAVRYRDTGFSVSYREPR